MLADILHPWPHYESSAENQESFGRRREHRMRDRSWNMASSQKHLPSLRASITRETDSADGVIAFSHRVDFFVIDGVSNHSVNEFLDGSSPLLLFRGRRFL
jgi:hypothetical protein